MTRPGCPIVNRPPGARSAIVLRTPRLAPKASGQRSLNQMPDGSRSIHISESTSRGTKVSFGSNRGHLHIVSPHSPDRGRRRAESHQSVAGPQPLVFDEGHTAEIRARLALLVVVGSTCCSGVSLADFGLDAVHDSQERSKRASAAFGACPTAGQRRKSESGDTSGPWKQPTTVRRTEPSTRDTTPSDSRNPVNQRGRIR
jgi:hypothetical protein